MTDVIDRTTPDRRAAGQSGGQPAPSAFLPSLLRDDDFVDLGEVVDPSYAGIYSPRDEVGTVPRGVTAQFLENPEDFHHAAADTGHSEWLIQTAIAKVSPLRSRPVILDVGSGSGNTALAMLKALDDPTIIASDISRPLLRSLLASARNVPRGDAIIPVCLDLNRPWFKDERFDLVVGRAILHHLFEPDILISNLYRSLKPGSSLIFFEPYECGYAFFGMLLDMIIETSHRLPGLADNVRAFLSITSAGYQKCEPKDVEEYADIDDKWNFSRRYFERIADRLGANVRVYPLYASAAPFTGELTFRLKAAIGAETDALPQWAWDLVASWEKRLSQDALDEMACAVNVTFTKPAN